MMLYVIPDPGASLSLTEQTEKAVIGGATTIQLRSKDMSGIELYNTACQISRICRDRNVIFIVNDRVDIALASGADGVHLGQSDLPCKAVRKIVPEDFIVGISARTVEEALQAERDGADYLGCGAIFATGSKSDAIVIGPDDLKQITRTVSIPVVAIGGISTDNAPEAFRSGADGIAVIHEAFSSCDVIAAVERLADVCKANL